MGFVEGFYWYLFLRSAVRDFDSDFKELHCALTSKARKRQEKKLLAPWGKSNAFSSQNCDLMSIGGQSLCHLIPTVSHGEVKGAEGESTRTTCSRNAPTNLEPLIFK